MSKTEHIATARRIVASDPASKKAPAVSNTAAKKDNNEEDDVFLKKINKWSDRDRAGWKWSQRPSHRNKTIGAALSQGALLSKNASDVSALQDVEESLSAMGTYIAEGNQEDRCHASDVAQNTTSVSDCLHIRERSKLKAKEDVARAAMENRSKGPIFHVDEAPHSPGMYRPIKPFDPDNLESVRRHNMFRQKQLDDIKRDMDSEKLMHNFHALPMPGHVPYVDPEQDDGSSPQAADSLVAFVAERKVTDPKPEKNRSPKKQKSTVAAAAEDFKAFFVTEGDNADGESSSSKESSDDDIDAELEELTMKEKELLSSYTKLSRQRNRAAQAAEVLKKLGGESLRDPFSTPRQMSADVKPTPRLHTPGSTPRHRPTSTDVLMRETTGGSGPSILDLDQKEREVLFKLKKEQKVRELKHELEVQSTKDLQRAPNITKAQESWRRAKEEHNRETLRQLQHEEMKQKLADMQEEMRIMRLEQKVNELRKVGDQKILKERLRGMVQAGLSQATASSSVKPKKVKRKRRTSSRDKTPVSGSASELSNNVSIFTEETDMGPQSSLAEESSLLGLKTNSLLEPEGSNNTSASPNGRKKGSTKRTRRNRLPPRGPNLSYSQFEAQDTIREEDEYDDEADSSRNSTSNKELVQQSALDLLSEEPSCIDDNSGMNNSEPQQRSFVGRSGRRRRQSPSLSYASQSDQRSEQGSMITYESVEDLVKESGRENVTEGMSMFSISGSNSMADVNLQGGRQGGVRGNLGAAGYSCRGDTPARSKPGNKRPSPSPYGVDLAAAFDSRYHHNSSPKVNRRKSSGGVNRDVDEHMGHSASEDIQGVSPGNRLEQRPENHYISSPTRSKPKLREYSSPHRNMFDVRDTNEKTSRPTSSRAVRDQTFGANEGNDTSSPIGPPTVRNRPGWSDAEPVNKSGVKIEDVSGRISGALSVRRSDVSSGVRSSRASTDLFVSDSESVISYDMNGNPQTLSPGVKPENSMKKSFGTHPSNVLDETNLRPSSAGENNVVKDPRYRHIDVYQRSGDVDVKAGSDIGDERVNAGYTFVPRPSSSNRRHGLSSETGIARPDSSQKNTREAVALPTEPVPLRPSSAIGRGEVGERFFDSSSTQDKGRFRVNDARDFHTKSMHRRPDTLDEGVTLLLGVRRTTNTGASGGGLVPSASQAGGDFPATDEEVITVLFDRAQFSEDRARAWWQMNKERILNISKFK